MFLKELVPLLYDQTGLEEDREIEFVSRINLPNTSHKKFVYRVVGTEDAIILHIEISKKGEIQTTAKLSNNYFSDRHNYGEESRKTAQKYQLPIEVVLAISPEYTPEFAKLVEKLIIATGLECELVPYRINNIAVEELSSKSISRKRRAILALFPGMSSGLKERVKTMMGSKNLNRMAKFLLSL